MRNALARPPGPVVIAPKCSNFVTAGSDEFEILTIGYFVLINVERRSLDSVGLKLIVPPKSTTLARKAERNRAGRNLDAALMHRRRVYNGRAGLRNFLCQRQLMQHVCQRFR